MKKYSLINNILGWVVCLIASIVYLMTAEPSASWWDCGEYIATAFKLQVGHPPGAPTFQLLGRLFSLFAGGDTAQVARMVNSMSALCSGFTILFLFWTITMLAKKLIVKGEEMTTGKMIAIFGSGVVGALAYTFSDTFWYSAVEGEVYAMSSFFTALVFWAILKWESQADDKHNLRWIILIAFLVGISIGVHLLNLLAIPAMTYVFYYKKYPKTTKKGLIFTFILSMLIVLIVLYIVVPQIVSLAGKFEVFFVNSIGMPFNTGTIIFFALLIGLIAWGLIFTRKKVKPIWNTAILSLLFLIIGYSTFFILVIRANANTPLNENAPKDSVGLLTYLNREQYGYTPLFYGPYYDAQAIDQKEGSPKYIKDEQTKSYIKVKSMGELVYQDDRCTLFPRMYSKDEGRRHVTYYKYWTGISGDRLPSFSDNLTYFIRYQCNFMYWRYFMWNFVGRQNDIQGFGINNSGYDPSSNGTKDLLHGNWISGINFLDAMRLGPQDNLPSEMANNKGRNTLFFLPLILGLCGLIYQFQKDKKNTFVVFLLFFMTGLAIVLYLNQPPQQPRERDYAYAGSFYAFAIWIGLGVYGIYDWLKKVKMNESAKAVCVSVVCLVAVPILMASQEWDDHDRSGRYMTRDFARNYIESCDKNAVLITFGDNDTFPLWYCQEVEGIRPDVRILNYTLAGMSWYTEQLYNKVYEADKCPFTLPKKYYGLAADAGTGYVAVVNPQSDSVIELADALKELVSNPATTQMTQTGDSVKVLLYNNFKITSAQGVFTFTIPTDQNGMKMLQRSELMLLDILATNHFVRPIYTVSPTYFQGIIPNITEYIRQEGLCYRIMPTKENGNILTAKTYNLMMNTFTWRGVSDPKTYLEEAVTINNTRNMRQQHMVEAKALIAANNKAMAIKILDKAQEVFPDSKVYFDKYDIQFANQYAEAGNVNKCQEILNKIADLYIADVHYYNRFTGKKALSVQSDKNEALQILAMIYSNAAKYNMTTLCSKIKSLSEVGQFIASSEAQNSYNDLVEQVNSALAQIRSGNKTSGESSLIAVIDRLATLVNQAKSQDFFNKASELVVFAYSQAQRNGLEKLKQKIMSNRDFAGVIQAAVSQQQAGAQQQQGQNQGNGTNVNIQGL